MASNGGREIRKNAGNFNKNDEARGGEMVRFDRIIGCSECGFAPQSTHPSHQLHTQ